MFFFGKKIKRVISPAATDHEIKSKLDELHDKLNDDKITSKIHNEAQTRFIIVDYFVSALGYDIEDPDSVYLEYKITVDGNPKHIDYALMDNDKPIALVEAKKTGESLTKKNNTSEIRKRWTKQIKMYFDNCASARVIILTNGYKYYFFTRDAVAAAVEGSDKIIAGKEFIYFDLSDSQSYNTITEKLIELLHNRFNTDGIIHDDVRKAVNENVIEHIKRINDCIRNDPPKEVIDAIRKDAKCSSLVTDDELKAIISKAW